MIAHDRGPDQVSAFKAQFRRRSTRITINTTIMRAIAAAYSLAAGPVNWDAGRLTNRTVAATIAIVIARPIQVLCRRIFLEFTIVACSEMVVMANLDSKYFWCQKCDSPNHRSSLGYRRRYSGFSYYRFSFRTDS